MIYRTVLCHIDKPVSFRRRSCFFVLYFSSGPGAHPAAAGSEHNAPALRKPSGFVNDRILQKFYDAKVIDIRTGMRVNGKNLGCERTKRSENRVSSKSLRKYRGKTTRKGYCTIRKERTKIKPGSIILFEGELLVVHGTHAKTDKKGKKSLNVEFTVPAQSGAKSTNVKNVVLFRQAYVSAWKKVI